MFRKVATVAVAGAFIFSTTPSFATILTLPIVGDIEHPDMDPFHVLSPPAPEPAPAMPMKKHHKKKKKM